MDKPVKKTWKRETAWAILLFCGYLAIDENIEALSIIAPFGFVFAGAAFGMDWASKQTTLSLSNKKET